MTDHQFDIVVLGGGSGGYAAALRAAELGKSVALIEKEKVGGTCLHRGCIPTKALLHAAEVAENARSAASVGVRATFEAIDPVGLRAYREGIVAKKFRGLEGLVKARGITTVSGEGALEAGLPVRVIVLGGGVIGVEFASVWRSFGADVTIIEALPHLAPAEDPALSKGLERAFRKRGIAFSLGVRFAAATQTD